MYAIISGTNRAGSNTFKVARQYQQLLMERGNPATLVTLESLDVNKRSHVIKKLEEEVLIPSKKMIFVTPEYNGSIPGVLKSFIDISEIQMVWPGKKALLIGVSTGRAGNLRGMDHLTSILNYVKVVVHPNKLPISLVHKLLDESGTIADETTLKAMCLQLDEFISF